MSGAPPVTFLSVPVRGTEDQREAFPGAGALDGEAQPVAGAVCAGADDQFLTGVDGPPVEPGDDVARPQARPGGGAARCDGGPAVGGLSSMRAPSPL